jgi:hypothetical protein
MIARASVVLALSTLLGAAACGGADLGNEVPGGGDDDAGPGPDAALPRADAAPDHYQPAVGPEVDGKLVINELMTSNAYTMLDDTGTASDWVEIYNPGNVDVPLRGYSFTDELGNPRKAIITRDATVKAHGYLVFFMDGMPEAGATHVGLQLATQSAALGLARPDGSYIDRVSYGKQETDFSAAREPDGSDAWQIEWHPTPGAANKAGAGHPVGVEDPHMLPEGIPEAGDLSQQILGYDAVPELAFSVTPENAAKLIATPFEYVPAYIIYQGRSYGPVGLRCKGANSFEPFDKKPSLRVSIDKYNDKARFFGMKDLTLNNMHSDFSMMHERLAYRVARDAGIPASRSNHALVYVNGQFYGLYANVESVKKQMVERWFADATGPLFEATDVDFLPPYIAQYSLESGMDDRRLLEGAADALLMTNADAAIAAASQFVDIDQFTRFWAVCAVVGQFDSFPYSMPGDDYDVYADPASGKLHFIPWGMDESFYSADFDVRQVSSVLAQKCTASPACLQKFNDQVWSVIRMTEDMGLEAERARVVAQIAPYVALDHRKSYTAQEVATYQDNLHWFITERRMRMAAFVPPPVQAAP